ncbi:acetate/propionate family kinase [Marinomonas ostreistagni]|uniref:acetate/propionate family kinase n=1 Tax=Marinomonas ostreistagni TaxID=359209 RepID=UPI00195128C6|nr:acetate kinase [Marinomonas ostreistagni]MBM6550255.1 acetate kinase [Marinomonas ostreistagni]
MKQQALVINCGSSSLKFAIQDASESAPLLEGIAERLGSEHSTITFKYAGTKTEQRLYEHDHRGAVSAIKAWIDDHPEAGIQLAGGGHRVVHGGETFHQSAVIDEDVLEGIEQCAIFAPLHNPAHVKGIKEAQALFGELPHVAVFDTSFHQTLTQDQYLYPIPMRLYRNHHFRKYGFHGTSYRYIAQKLASLDANYGTQNALVAHLGNGASVCAIKAGSSVDTSMGITPLEGLMMGTRSGSLDPSLLAFIADAEGISMKQALDILNKESGLKGISEISNDCRTLETAQATGDDRADLALTMFASRAAKQLASVATNLDSIEHVIFTGGIGENSPLIRSRICKRLTMLGVELDHNANQTAPRGELNAISPTGARIKVWIIPTNEELLIAQDTLELINAGHKPS